MRYVVFVFLRGRQNTIRELVTGVQTCALPIFFSMFGTEVMTPYMVAAKSLHHHLKRGRMVIMDDGTLTDRDRSLLRQHLDNPQIISIRDSDTGPCPRG